MKELFICGIGIKDISHMTYEVMGHIKNAELVIYSTYNSIAEYWIKKEAKKTISLDSLYKEGKDLNKTYQDMSNLVLDSFTTRNYVVCLFYGHPTVFVKPIEIISNNTSKFNISTTILPGISSIDCLFSDLIIDPLKKGVQIYDATKFIIDVNIINKNTPLILLQIGFISSNVHKKNDDSLDGILLLTQKLLEYYIDETNIILYEAASTLLDKPVIDIFYLKKLPEMVRKINKKTTLVIPEQVT